MDNLYLRETEDERILYVTGSGASGGAGPQATAPTITVT
jgi:hypothetical protein